MKFPKVKKPIESSYIILDKEQKTIKLPILRRYNGRIKIYAHVTQNNVSYSAEAVADIYQAPVKIKGLDISMEHTTNILAPLRRS